RDGRNGYRCAPGLAAVGRTKGINAAAREGHDDGPIGLNHGLTAEPASMVGRGYARAPGQSAVARGAHQDVAAAVRLIPFRVAVAIVRAAGGVIAGGPILIVQVSVINDDGLSPVEPVGGTAHGNVSDRARVLLMKERKCRDQPFAVFCIVGNGGVCRPPIRSAFVLVRQRGEKAVGPGFAAVGGGGPPYVCTAPAD